MVFLVVAFVAIQQASQDPIDLALASRYFREARQASDDVGSLWSQPLYGPTMFIDRATRFAVANQPDKEGKLTQRGDVWVGQMPPGTGVANSDMEWSGVHWSTVVWPLNVVTVADRNMLILHEGFHRIQRNLGLPPGTVSNAHLDTKDGRTWLRMEWRALSRALISWGPERTESLTHALTFRAYRRSLFPSAAKEEDRMEVHEGLAEYSGIRAMGLSAFGRRSYLAGRIKLSAATKPSYTYAFAYETGPAYGLLLDMDSKDWRQRLTPRSSLSGMLAEVAKIQLPKDLARESRQRAGYYQGGEVIREEEARHKELQAKLKHYRRLLVEGPVLELPLPNGGYSYDPNEVVPLGEFGTVYPGAGAGDEWGYIDFSKGARLVGQPTKLFVSAPTSADLLSGDGWKLTLKPGWKVVPGERKGDYRVVRG